MPAALSSAPSFSETLKIQFRIFYAIMMHDIKARFFGSGIGYIVTILWPSVHIAVLIGIFYFTGRTAPYGDNVFLYAAIGTLPYIIWNYVSRFTHLGVSMNKSFLQYPLIKPLDLMIARQALEVVSVTVIIFGLSIFLTIVGADVLPPRPEQAVFALLSALLLGIGFGVLGGVISMVFPLFNIIYVGILLLFWITAGVAIDPEAMPARIGYYFSWNPLLHSIEWLRYAYYDDFPARLLDKTYVLMVGASTLTLGLVLERVLRPFTTR